MLISDFMEQNKLLPYNLGTERERFSRSKRSFLSGSSYFGIFKNCLQSGNRLQEEMISRLTRKGKTRLASSRFFNPAERNLFVDWHQKRVFRGTLLGNYDLQFKVKITFNSLRIHKKGGHDFLDAVIVLPSGFAISPGHLPAVPVHGNGASQQGPLYKTHCILLAVLERVFLKGAQFGGESLLAWDRYIRGFSERQKIIVTFQRPLVLELSTHIIGLHEAYDFHHTLFCHPTLFMLFSCLSLPRRFFAAYMHIKQDKRKNLILCSWLSKN